MAAANRIAVDVAQSVRPLQNIHRTNDLPIHSHIVRWALHDDASSHEIRTQFAILQYRIRFNRLRLNDDLRRVQDRGGRRP